MGLSLVPKESLAYVTEPPARLSPSPQNQNSLPEEGMGDPSVEEPSVVEEAPLPERDVSQKPDDSFPEEGIPDAFSRPYEDRFQPKKKPSVSSPDKISKHYKDKDKDTE